MSKYYTIMAIPDEKGSIKKIRVPKILVHSFSVFMAAVIIIVSVMLFDYWKIFQEVQSNKYINQENILLKEQVSLFKIKLDQLSQELDRLHIFEKKLKIITGLEKASKTKPTDDLQTSVIPTDFKKTKDFIKTQKYYTNKLKNKIRLQKNDQVRNDINNLPAKSQAIANDLAELDIKHSLTQKALTQVESSLHDLDEFSMDKESILQSTPTLLPANGWITSYFGPRLSPYAKKKKVKMHEGLDIGAPIGTKISSPADGTITFSGKRTGFGNMVKINHGYGVETLYAHAHKLHVRTGQKVKRGDRIAQVGNTGYSTGPHLHYEVHVNGIAVDPFYFILQ